MPRLQHTVKKEGHRYFKTVSSNLQYKGGLPTRQVIEVSTQGGTKITQKKRRKVDEAALNTLINKAMDNLPTKNDTDPTDIRNAALQEVEDGEIPMDDIQPTTHRPCDYIPAVLQAVCPSIAAYVPPPAAGSKFTLVDPQLYRTWPAEVQRVYKIWLRQNGASADFYSDPEGSDQLPEHLN